MIPFRQPARDGFGIVLNAGESMRRAADANIGGTDMHIETKQTLNMENMITFRMKVKAAELQMHMERLLAYAKSCGAIRIGNGVSATYAVDGDVVDIEVYIPINKRIPSNEEFVFKPLLRLENCIKIKHKGDPHLLQNSMQVLNDYVTVNQLVPIAVGFTVIVNDVTEPRDFELFEVDLYLSLSPNVI